MYGSGFNFFRKKSFGAPAPAPGFDFDTLDLNIFASNKIDGTPPDITTLIDSVNAYNFTQAAASNKPHYNAVDITADHNGLAHYIESVPLATAIKTDAIGMITMYFRDDKGVGAINYLMSFHQNNATQIRISFNAADKFTIEILDAVKVNLNTSFLATTPARGGFIKLQFGNNGVDLVAYINNVQISIDSSTGSEWFSYLTTAITKVSLGIGWGAAFGAFGLRHLGYVSGRVLTPAEISAINSSPEYQEIFAP